MPLLFAGFLANKPVGHSLNLSASGTFQKEQSGILQITTDMGQEAAGLGSIGDPMVEGQREGQDVANLYLILDDPGFLANAAAAENGDVGIVDDRGGKMPAEGAEIGQGEGAAGQLFP